MTNYDSKNMHDGLSFKELRDSLGEKSKELSFLINLDSGDLSRRIIEAKNNIEAVEIYACSAQIREYLKFLKLHVGLKIEELEKKLNDFEEKWDCFKYQNFTILSGQKVIEENKKIIKECEEALCVSKILSLMGWSVWHAPEYTAPYCDYYNGVPIINFIGSKEEFLLKHEIEPRRHDCFKPDDSEKV